MMMIIIIIIRPFDCNFTLVFSPLKAAILAQCQKLIRYCNPEISFLIAKRGEVTRLVFFRCISVFNSNVKRQTQPGLCCMVGSRIASYFIPPTF